MNVVTVTDDTNEIDVTGLDQLWSFKGRLTIPRSAVSGVALRTDDVRPPWLRAPGTYLPKVIAAGTYYDSNSKDF